MANKKLIAGGVVAVIAIGGIIWWLNKKPSANSDTIGSTPSLNGGPASVVVKDPLLASSDFFAFADRYFSDKSPISKTMYGGVSGDWFQRSGDEQSIRAYRNGQLVEEASLNNGEIVF